MIRPAAWSGALVLVLAAGCTVDPSFGPLVKIMPRPIGSRIVDLENDDPDVRRDAVQAIAKSGKAESVPTLVRLLCLVAKKDSDPMVRAAAAQALGDVEGEGVLETLKELLAGDSSPLVRADAAASLGKKASPDGLEALVAAMKADPNLDVRLAAEGALRHYKDRAAADALVEGLSKSDIGEAQKCWESLRYMTGQNLPRDAAPWEEFLASADAPFARHGRPPGLPKGESQRPAITKGVRHFVGSLFEQDVREGELE